MSAGLAGQKSGQGTKEEAKAMVEAEFTTQTNHQAPLEPEISSAYFEGEGDNPQLIVVGRSIQIHTHLAQLKEAVGYQLSARALRPKA